MISKYQQSIYKLNNNPSLEIFQLRNNELGRDAVKLLNERFKGVPYVGLDISVLKENNLVGRSSPYIRWAIGPIVRELMGNDVQLLTPAFSELALKQGALPNAESTYEDLAVVVYNTEEPNSKLAQHLINVAKERRIDVQFPMIFYNLETKIDGSFKHGLRLDFDDTAVAYHVPILSEKTGKFDPNDPELVKTGFPGKLGEGERKIYTVKDGLMRFFRSGALKLHAYYGTLTDSASSSLISFTKMEKQNWEDTLK